MSIINSTLNLFYIPNLPEENFALDKNDADETLVSILENIDSDSLSIRNFQLQRIQLDNIFVIAADEITAIRLADDSDDKTYNYNYAVLEQVLQLDDETTEIQEIPYKVIKIIWNGTESVKLICRLDVATFFNDRVDFNTNCLIERAHIDRFEGESGGYLIPRIDYHEEPIDEPIKYLSSDTNIQDIIQDTTGWNLLYYSDPNTSTGVRTFIVPDSELRGTTVRVNNSSYIELVSDTYFIIRGVDNPGTTITFDSNTFTFGTSGYDYEEAHWYNNGGTFTLTIFGFTLTGPVNNFYYYSTTQLYQYTSTVDTYLYYDNDLTYYTNPLNELQFLDTNTNSHYIPFTPKTKIVAYLNATSSSETITGLSDIPLINTRIIKIVACPFCPADITDSPCLYVNVSDDFMNVNLIEYKSTNAFDLLSIYSSSTGFISSYIAPASYDLQTPNTKYETKLLNSKYFECDIEYGAYKLNIPLEMYRFSSAYKQFSYSFLYKQAKLKSDLLFKINPNNPLKSEFAGLENVTANYLISDIDNEKPIFTNDYITYMKTGYNYDKNNMNRQTVVSSLLAGTSILGGVAGVAAGAATGGISAAAGIGLITSGVSSAINIINNRIASEASIQRKLTSYKNSSTGIAGVNAIDLREEYEGYHPYVRQYTVSAQTKDNIYKLFNNYGYQLNISDTILSYMHNRRYFNFIKASKVVFDSVTLAKYRKHQELLNEYSKILNEGLTIYHCINKNSFDFDKEYENFETSLT